MEEVVKKLKVITSCYLTRFGKARYAGATKFTQCCRVHEQEPG